MKTLASLCILCLAVSFTACTTRITDFTAISTKNINAPLKPGARVKGQDCSNLLFHLIPVSGPWRPHLKEAIDRALEAGRGDILIDGVVRSYGWFVPLLFHQSCYTVEGTAATLTDKARSAP